MAKQTLKDPTCKCIDKNETAMRVHVENNSPHKKTFQFLGGTFENKSLHPVERLYTRYMYEYTHTLKTGEQSKIKKGVITVFFSHCPFCGKKMPQ